MSEHTRNMPVGVQVMKMSQEPGRRYEVDEQALASVLLRADVRSLPVMVVSVAGAYRGGKSFILDFFLRYLKAPRASQLSGEWLGSEDEALEGFDWRGGGESNTKGIHLWPEPIIVTIDRTGEKVAVLLMDTQGTFDTESDMGDNSAIFALSTLLSSVQIYNLRANIGEDDLQHLQLFTEYGKLASGADGKAFQTLNFLIRDWMSAYEHPYGYEGGQALLQKRLAPRSNEKQQLQQVREHIHSCFEKLVCFLMPHPGLAVGDRNFRGRLCDITEHFRMSLLELVPSLFDPDNLTPKLINGEKVQAQGFLEYFKRYVEIFNSDDLPQATSIFQATADACMMLALREARERYESQMDRNVIEDDSVTTSMIHEWHAAAVDDAVEHFKAKKKLGSEENINTHLEDLEKELAARLSLYLWQNDAKARDAVARAKSAYESSVRGVCEEQSRLCLHARDLHALHDAARRAALQLLQQARPRVPPASDDQRDCLLQGLEQLYRHLCAVNEQNNRNAELEAREVYLSRMKEEACQAGVSSDELKRQHEKALAEAIKHFHSYRNRRTEHEDDPVVEQLRQEITVYFGDFERANVNSNMWAMQVAEYTYNNCVSSAWGPQSCCFHPHALRDLHGNARARALEQFLADRPDSENDDYKNKLIANLESRYEELVRINQFNNKQAVELAYNEYTRLMDKHSQPNLSSIIIAPFIVKMFALLPDYHRKSKSTAMSMFKEKRRGSTYDDDEYFSSLETKIDAAFEDYSNPLKAIIRELGLQHLIRT
ncbi:atlastin-3-like [Anticarsia gemmatalis]|uniref:atlastin-3-like n=1 Tax=Anticarsia gemmatalis TaxID=129554 RepID=UPI003F76AB01